MTRPEINHDPTPIRLFKSDFFEFFTHISPLAVLAIWVPVAVFFLWRAIANHPAGSFPWHIPLGALLGLFLWTLAEYLLHRFVFHFHAQGPRIERIIFLFHGIHHYQPDAKTRLVMPPVVSLPLALIFYALFYGLGALLRLPAWVDPAFFGFIIGYLAYDMIHYATHHIPMKRQPLKFLRRYHMQHHFKTPDQRYGVSSPLWDIIFGTMPEE